MAAQAYTLDSIVSPVGERKAPEQHEQQPDHVGQSRRNEACDHPSPPAHGYEGLLPACSTALILSNLWPRPSAMNPALTMPMATSQVSPG